MEIIRCYYSIKISKKMSNYRPKFNQFVNSNILQESNVGDLFDCSYTNARYVEPSCKYFYLERCVNYKKS